MSEALVIIDYSNDFVASDGKLTAGEVAQAIDGNIADRIRAFHAAGKPIFFMMDIHYEDDTYHPETKLFPPHNIAGTKGRELYGEVGRTYAEIHTDAQVFFIDKTRYSSFVGTNLDSLLRERQIDHVVLTGVVTDICVLHTAISAYNLGYSITVPKNCVATFNDGAQDAVLYHMEHTLGARIE